MTIRPGELILPGVEEIKLVHKATILKHGGLRTPPNDKKIKSALDEVLIYHSYKPESDISQLSAVIAYSFAKGHPLPDGNKRVAFASVRMTMRANGFRWKPRHDEAEQRFWRLAGSSPSLRNEELICLSDWIREDCFLIVEVWL